MNRHTPRTLTLAALLCATAVPSFAGTPAAQANWSTPVSASVSYADIDLESIEGREELSRRLRLAARQVCGAPDLVKLELSRASANKRCASNAVDRALSEIHGKASLLSQVEVRAVSTTLEG